MTLLHRMKLLLLFCVYVLPLIFSVAPFRHNNRATLVCIFQQFERMSVLALLQRLRILDIIVPAIDMAIEILFLFDFIAATEFNKQLVWGVFDSLTPNLCQMDHRPRRLSCS